MNDLTPNPSTSQQSYVNLSPETRKLLAELYGAWIAYTTTRPYLVPFHEWLEFTAGNLWLASDMRFDEPRDPNGGAA